ncbi:MAG: family 2 glycosyl transferase [Nocardioides sp.]|nr:family 2 glycosyl transferase [Nocardioides sp.]
MSQPAPIGQALLDAGLVTPEQLDAALERQRTEGGHLGQQLVLGGAVSRRELYGALAEQWSAPLVDLVADPPDDGLVRRVPYDAALREGWVPWRPDPDRPERVLVATTEAPTDALRAQVAAHLGTRDVAFRTTTPWDLWKAVEASHRADLLFESQERLHSEQPAASAADGLTQWQRWAPLGVLLVVVGLLVANPAETFVVMLALANVVFFAAVLFKTTAALLVPFRHRRRVDAQWRETRERARRGLPPRWAVDRPDHELPVYTVLVPVFREANVVQKVVENIGSLDYPKSKLDVMLLMEADDEETIAVARAMRPPEYVRLVVVPPGKPQTKPRACNYGLTLARGEFVVIYDAEDRPDPDQLRQAVAAFDRDELMRREGLSHEDPLAVVQASLYYYNADYNVLTRMFAIEYAHWFEAMLPGMDEAGLPMPLGGTSNHFRADVLRAMGAWDPFNVTEDADAGLRAAVEGYRVDVLPSGTGEEACAETFAWIRQRTRWIKGYLVTAAVNTRHPIRFSRRVGVRGVIGMVGLIMATPVAFLAYPLALGFTATTYVGVQWIGLDLPEWVVGASVTTFLFGNAMMIVSAALAASWRYSWRIGGFALLSPLYWLLHSIAAWRALYQTVKDPHRWEKTPHGLTEDYESEHDQHAHLVSG